MTSRAFIARHWPLIALLLLAIALIAAAALVNHCKNGRLCKGHAKGGADMGTMAVMGGAGDTKIIWDSTKPEEVDNARRSFDDLRKKGYLAFRVTGEKGDKGQQIYNFEPNAEKLILAPPLRGGV